MTSSEHYTGEELGMGRPKCPACGSENVALGTSYAYFVCYDPKCNAGHTEHATQRFGSHEVYWTKDHRHPSEHSLAWMDAIMASPYGRARWIREHGPRDG